MPMRVLLALLLAAGIYVLAGCSQASLEEMIELANQDDPELMVAGKARPQKPVDNPCKVQAFLLYCLGGDIQPLLNSRETIKQEVGEHSSTYLFRDTYWVTKVTAFRGKIVHVSRSERPASWNTLETARRRLENDHGLSEDHSNFPPGIEEPRDKMQAVFNGRGWFLYEWDRSKWRLDIRWDNMREISVSYMDKELEQDFLAGRP